ncbi:MAG TPA: PQQ-binding-like beta-propeller repeat protein [Pyrinomonadaceae bacterium]|nr:PQQ-binding-like beta-propeller repeat protein [Pyrinomonadaceae bacterium]
MKTLFSIFLFVLSTGLTPARDFVGHTRDVSEVKFNPDATRLISYSAGDGWLCLWEVKSGRLLWRSKTEFIQKADEYYTLTSFAFSPDRNLIASSSGNGTIQLWDATTGRFLWRADAHQDSVTAIEFSPDGKTIASAASPEESEDEIKILRVDDGQIIKKLEGKSCTVIAMKFDENGKLLRTGNLDGSVSEWNLGTGKQNVSAPALPCRIRRTYQWETSFPPDLKISAMRTGEKELTLTDTQTNTVRKKLEAEAYRVYSKFSADGKKIIVSGYGGFTFYDLATGETRKIDEFSGTGSTIDLSRDGSLFAEGGSYGDAAIKITDTKTGKSWSLGGRSSKQRLPPYQPGELERRLTKEKEQRQAILNEAKVRRDKQAAIDTKKFGKQVYITFEHYGEMTDPGQQRMVESGEPSKSKAKKSAGDADAIWLRLHNDSPLPIKIPTQSMYLPNPKCFHEFPNGRKILGLCNDREISIWHGLENKNGKQIPYGFDFGSSAILLPKTSILFAVSRAVLKNGNAIRFGFTFQKETRGNKVEDYGTDINLKFRESDLPDLPEGK